MNLKDIFTADDLTAEGLAVLKAHWLPLIVTDAPEKLSTALGVVAVRIEAQARGDTALVASANQVLELLIENVEARIAYRAQDTAAELALIVLKIAGKAAAALVLP